MRKLLFPGISITILVAAMTLSAGASDSKIAGVTFTKDVAPLLYSNCAECHRPTGIAPMALITYKDVRPWAKSIKQRVAERSMPPWFADPNHGEFSNNPSLAQKDIDAIVAWVDAGSPKVTRKTCPPHRSLSRVGPSASPMLF
jgi:mono/diheme cytochrome c family protein